MTRKLLFPMAKRLFIALELPESCRAVLASLDPKIKGLRWIPPEQLHATMSFLDRVTQEQEEKLQEALTIVRVPPFFLPIQGVGTFGGSKPTVVWAGLGKAHPHLFALHKHIQDAVLKSAWSLICGRSTRTLLSGGLTEYPVRPCRRSCGAMPRLSSVSGGLRDLPYFRAC